jgi:hypothetical protein
MPKNTGVSKPETPKEPEEAKEPEAKEREPVFVEVEGMGKQGVKSDSKQTLAGGVLTADHHEKTDKPNTLFSDQRHPKNGTVVVEQPEPVLGKFHEEMGETTRVKAEESKDGVLASDHLLEKPGVVMVEQPVHDDETQRSKGKTHELATAGDVVVSDSHAKENS